MLSKCSCVRVLPGLIRNFERALAQAGSSALPLKPLDDAGHGARGFGRVDGHAHDFASGARELGRLRGGGLDVLGGRVGHRLHGDRRPRPDENRRGGALEDDPDRHLALNHA